MRFVNRQKELQHLNEFLKLKNGGVGVIWGRRRIGKTRLLLQWTGSNGGVYFVADESAPSIQRKFFSLALDQVFSGFSQVEYPDWHSIFFRLTHEAKKKKWSGPVIIDELPYLITNSPELPSVLQKWIDHEVKKSQLKVIFCGSSQRMMQGAILEPAAPLYGRADLLIKLKPISIGYMKQALKLKSAIDVIEFYSIWGGIPRYWELVERVEGDLFEKIDRLVLDPMGPLIEEPQRLLLEESPSATHLRAILDAIGLGANRLSEVASRLGEPTTSLTRSIDRLIDLELIQKEFPYGVDPKSSKKTLYKIKDPFLRFWFKFVAPKRSLFSQVSEKIRFQWLKESLPSIFSLFWEELCREAIPSFSESWNIEYEQAHRFWHGKGFEWDIVSQSLDGSHLLLGEVKWSLKTPTQKWIDQCIQELKMKGVPPIRRKSNAQLQYVLFISKKPKNLKVATDVQVVDAEKVIALSKFELPLSRKRRRY